MDTAGSGIIHLEMAEGDQSDQMHGFQSWLHLSASLKMNVLLASQVTRFQAFI